MIYTTIGDIYVQGYPNQEAADRRRKELDFIGYDFEIISRKHAKALWESVAYRDPEFNEIHDFEDYAGTPKTKKEQSDAKD